MNKENRKLSRENLTQGLDILLHDHMDGASPLGEEFLPLLHTFSNLPYPIAKGNGAIKEWFADPQIDIVKKFSLTTNVMQNPMTLFLTARNHVIMRGRQGIRYNEITIAPQYHVFGDGVLQNMLTEKDVVNNIIAGIISGEDEFEAKMPGKKIEVNLIVAIGREIDSRKAKDIVRAVSECDRNYVVGIGLVCDEAKYPPEKHIETLTLAKKLGFKISCHAGEWVSAERDFEKDKPILLRNIRTAVFDICADRIGHAIALAYDSELIEAVAKKGIGIEGCPCSNLTSGLIKNVRDLKIDKLLANGILYSLNTDDDLFMPKLAEVFDLCCKAYGFRQGQVESFIKSAWLTRFGRRKFN